MTTIFQAKLQTTIVSYNPTNLSLELEVDICYSDLKSVISSDVNYAQI